MQRAACQATVPLGEREPEEALRQGSDGSRNGSGGGAERHHAGDLAGTAARGPQASQPEELQRGGGQDDGQPQGAHETPPPRAGHPTSWHSSPCHSVTGRPGMTSQLSVIAYGS